MHELWLTIIFEHGFSKINFADGWCLEFACRVGAWPTECTPSSSWIITTISAATAAAVAFSLPQVSSSDNCLKRWSLTRYIWIFAKFRLHVVWKYFVTWNHFLHTVCRPKRLCTWAKLYCLKLWGFNLSEAVRTFWNPVNSLNWHTVSERKLIFNFPRLIC